MKCILVVALLMVSLATPVAAGVITGTIYDATEMTPVGFATISVLGTGRSISANADGQYRLNLPPGDYQLKFSHVAHYSRALPVSLADSTLLLDVTLEPATIEVASISVYDRQYDAAQRIIVEAIRRKDEILSKLKEYSFDAYTKLVVRDTAKADSIDIILITETQLTAYWKYPNSYKEIITARKQSSNLKAENNLVTIGEILNFNRNRIDFGRQQVVSPTAGDALDNYNYYLLDTVIIDGHRAFLLEIEPQSQVTPLFEGTILIADSSFAVVGVDVGFNEGFDASFMYQPRYRQTYAQFDNEYWMPTLIQFDAIVDPKLPILSVYDISYTAALHQFVFDPPFDKNTFDEFALEVAPEADKVDSILWQTSQLVPLTDNELTGYKRIDSLEHAPKPLYKQSFKLALGLTFVTLTNKDLFHFNRVEGAYVGLGKTFNRLADRWTFRLKTGYAIDGEYWQHLYGINYLVSEKQRLTLDLEYHDQIRTGLTIISPPNGNATVMALSTKSDPYNYFLEKGFRAAIGTKLLDFTRLTLGYNHYDQYSATNHTDYSFFNTSESHRINPSIADGHLRSLTAEFDYDSRPLMKLRRYVGPIPTIPYTTFKAGVEYADDKLIDNDFNFAQYYATLYHVRSTLGLGITSLSLYAGASDRLLPPQRYFTVDFDAGLSDRQNAFHTLSDVNFGGNRVAAFYVSHDFGRRLFKGSGLPLLKLLPWTFSAYGGAFWTDLKDQAYQPYDEAVNLAKRGYSEIGFGIGRIFPLGMGLHFTWQMSSFDTNRFNVTLSGGMF